MFHSQAFKQAQIYAYNAPQHVWRPGSASPLAAIRWPTSKRIWLRGEIEDGSGGEGSGGEEKGEEGTRGRNFPPFWGQVYALGHDSQTIKHYTTPHIADVLALH